MLKKKFSLFVIVIMSGLLFAQENETNNVQELEAVDAGKVIEFNVKYSEVFEDFCKSISAESTKSLQLFVENTKKSLIAHEEFLNITRQYNDLFKQLNIIKNEIPKVTLTFSFERERWTNLVIPEDLNLAILKNSVTEEKFAQLDSELKIMTDSIEKIVFGIIAEIGKDLALIKELKDKSAHQSFRVGFFLS